MGSDPRRTCKVENKKVLCVVGLVLASVLIIQHFELPSGDSILSLSSGKAYFNLSDASGGAHRGSELDRNQSHLQINSSPPILKFRDPSLPKEIFFVPHNAEEEEMRERGISIAPKEVTGIPYKENAIASISPSFSNTAEPGIPAGHASLGFSPGQAPYESSEDVSPSTALTSGENASISAFPKRLNVSVAPMVSPSDSVPPINTDTGLRAPVEAPSPPTTANVNITSWKSDHAAADAHSTVAVSPPPPPPPPVEMSKSPVASVVTISEMNDMLLRSRASSFAKSPLWPTAADQDLQDARFQIEHATIINQHPGLYAPIYRNLSTFVRSYEIMEQKLRVYIYKDGKRPVFHHPKLTGIYSSEGWFMKLMEASNRFLTSNAGEAHLFYLPFSSQKLVDYVYVPDSHSFGDIRAYLKNYLDVIKGRYPHWNRTDGADHFLVACHDWAPSETSRDMANCIRAMCNADVKEGFQFGKDVSLPETNVHSSQNPMRRIGGMSPSRRTVLAFFAGRMHGYVRPVLLRYWDNKDPDMKIFGKLRKNSYVWHMKNSKYCICAKGYEVNSPRVVEAIIYGCVPVIVSDNFVPPFFEILKWDSFAVFVLERDIPNLKNILVSIPEKRYVVMQQRVKQVRQHFVWHNTPVKYDIFHMILHSVWYNRVMRLSPR